MDTNVANWRETGTIPISAETPAGVSVRYDPDFELLEGQIQKLEGLARETVDWAQVVQLGQRILRQKSKDLLVGSYVVVGLLHKEGLDGLAEGLACMEGMISEFWPVLFPEVKRLKARIGALNWMAAKAAARIAQGGLQDRADAVEACVAQLKQLDAAIREKIPADAPDLGELMRALEALASRNVEPRPAAAETQHAPQPSGGAPIPPTASAELNTAEDARQFIAGSIASFARALTVFRKAEPAAVSSYLLVRALAWYDIDALPSATDGRTMVPPPPAYVRSRYQDLAASSAWKELLDEAEDRVMEFPFWLDLHRMGDQALGGMGKGFAAARSALRTEVVALQTRLPGLADLQFSDGSPFADDLTRRWISSELIPQQAQPTTTAAAPGAEAESMAGLRENVRKLINDGNQLEALALLQDAVRSSSGERLRFLSQLELARTCFETGQLRPAIARLEILDGEIRKYSLEAWEPALCVEVLRLYWEALVKFAQTSRQPSPETVRQADGVYSRLCNLDVVAGLHLAQAMRR